MTIHTGRQPSAIVDAVISEVTANIDMGATYLLLFNGFGIKEYAGYAALQIRNAADDAFAALYADAYYVGNTGIVFIGSGATALIKTQNGDDSTVSLQARDSGVGLVNVARLVGAADPYFEATLPMVLLPVVTASLPATPVEGMIAYDATLNKLVVYTGAAWETVTSA